MLKLIIAVVFGTFYIVSLTIYFKELIIECSEWNHYFRHKIVMFIVFSLVGLVPILNLSLGISAHKERTKKC